MSQHVQPKVLYTCVQVHVGVTYGLNDKCYCTVQLCCLCVCVYLNVKWSCVNTLSGGFFAIISAGVTTSQQNASVRSCNFLVTS